MKAFCRPQANCYLKDVGGKGERGGCRKTEKGSVFSLSFHTFLYRVVKAWFFSC